MVQSILDPTINYQELKTLYTEDKNYDASLYELNYNSIPIMIALGQAKYTFMDQDIIYYPIYLVKNSKVDQQIGVYEILSSNLPNVIDGDGDLDLDKIDNPLFFQFVNNELFKSASLKTNNPLLDSPKKESDVSDDEEDSDNQEDSDNEEVEKDDDVDLDAENIEIETITEKEVLIEIPNQTEQQYKKELGEYKYSKKEDWFETYMKNNYFNIIDNEGSGDCLFAVIRDGLKTRDINMSVAEIREKLAEEADDEIYANYKEMFSMYDNSIKESQQQIKLLKKQNIDLKERIKGTKNKKDQFAILEKAKEVAAEFESAKKEGELIKGLKEEVDFMKSITSLEQFKNKIKTCEFWADTWAIGTLERILNIKLVLFSSEYYQENDINNVMQCGHLNDKILSEKGTFEPDYYILVDHTGSHYKLITYRSLGALQFQQMPFGIKMLITEKCLEKQAGPYYIIPAFKIFNENMGVHQDIILQDDEIETIKSPNDIPLYNDDDVFQFYIRSNNKPSPGKGNGEKIDTSNAKQYGILAKIPEWRRKLSNEYTSNIHIDGKDWMSVEHYYQASKFKNNKMDQDFYNLFALNSNSPISKDVELAKAAGSKSGKYEKQQIRPKNIEIDTDFYEKRSDNVLKEALEAKFTQNEGLKKLLLNTHKAKLVEYRRKQPPFEALHLMQLREKLNTFKE